MLHPPRAQVIEHRAEKHQEHIYRLAVGVKRETRENKQDISDLEQGYHRVEEKHRGQKHAEKNE
jgi:hypothetical protein